MPGGIMLVETRAESPDTVEQFNKWYDEVHIPEILAVDGFVSARRLNGADGETYLAIYEIEGDLETAKNNLTARQKTGTMSPPQGVQLNPPPVVRYFANRD